MPYVTEGMAALGTLLARSTDGTAYTVVAEISNIDGPGGDVTEVDITHHQSDGGYAEFVMSLKDGKEVKLDMNFLPSVAAQSVLRTDYDARVKRYWKITFPDTATATFQAYVKMPPSPKAPVKGKLEGSATLRVTGQVTITAST
jgi:hypothetical protein